MMDMMNKQVIGNKIIENINTIVSYKIIICKYFYAAL